MEQIIINSINILRPSFQNEGGDITYIKTSGYTVYITLVGTCTGSEMEEATLVKGVENFLRLRTGATIIVKTV